MSEDAATPSAPTRRVRPWIAAILSLLVMGLGQYYARRPRRALAWVALALVLSGATIAALHVFEDTAWLVLAPALVAAQLSAAIDAFVSSRACQVVRRGSPLRYLGYLAVIGLVLVPSEIAERLFPVRTYFIPSTSMAPTLVPSDRVLVRMRTPLCPALEIRRGDIVLIRETLSGAGVLNDIENDADVAMEVTNIRRVVGVAGDQVEVSTDGLSVNGKVVTGPLTGGVATTVRFGVTIELVQAEESFADVRPWTVYASPGPDWGPAHDTVVPAGHVFALGDNRFYSNDDRINGPTPIDAVIGKALRVPFSLGDNPGVSWRNLRVRDGVSCTPS